MPILFNTECRGIAAAGCPIRKSPDQSLLAAPRGLSQIRHVLHRLLTPRHPPEALGSLTKNLFIPGAMCLIHPYSVVKDHGSQRAKSEKVKLDRYHLLVEITGLEPVTFCVQGRCSPKLSYIPSANPEIQHADLEKTL